MKKLLIIGYRSYVEAVKGELEYWKHYKPHEHLYYFYLTSITNELNEIGYKVLEHNFIEGSIRNPESPEDIITVVARRI